MHINFKKICLLLCNSCSSETQKCHTNWTTGSLVVSLPSLKGLHRKQRLHRCPGSLSPKTEKHCSRECSSYLFKMQPALIRCIYMHMCILKTKETVSPIWNICLLQDLAVARFFGVWIYTWKRGLYLPTPYFIKINPLSLVLCPVVFIFHFRAAGGSSCFRVEYTIDSYEILSLFFYNTIRKSVK